MPRRMFSPLVFLPVLAGFFVGAGPAFADRRVALVVGNSAYQHATTLENTLNDATAIADMFGELGFEVLRGQNLARDDFYTKGEEFLERVRGADVAVFFYAGHGLQVNGRNYLMPVDATLENELSLLSELVPLADFVNATLNRPVNLVFLDACRNNPAAAMKTSAFSLDVRHGRLAQMANRSGRVLAYATQPGSVAYDGEGEHSPYTAALLRHLRTPGLDVFVLLNEVGKSVVESTEGLQMPAVLSLPLEKDFFFRPGTDPAEEAFEAAGQFERRSIDIGEAIKRYETVTQLFPDSASAKEARQRIQQLRRTKYEIEQIRKIPPQTRDKRALVFVPAGKFLSGCGQGRDLCTAGRIASETGEEERADTEKIELTSTHVDAFWIDMREVTVAAYRQCVDAGVCNAQVTAPHPHPGNKATDCTWNKNDPLLPINCVNWEQARTYCTWAGKRLPNQMEWEKAARGKDGRETPWGSSSGTLVANLADEALEHYERWPEFELMEVRVTRGYTDQHLEIAPVGSYPAGASPYGVLDMSGNVWEWVEDRRGEDQGRYRRGGSWLSHLNRTRTFFHAWQDPSHRRINLGFRCAMSPPPPSPPSLPEVVMGD